MTKISVWILGDQLLNPHPALVAAKKEIGQENVTVLLVESRALVHRLPYHAKKLVLILSAMRHYAQEIEALGYRVDYQQAPNFIRALQQHIKRYQSDKLLMMASSNLGGKAFQQHLKENLGIPVHILDNDQFLSARFDPFPDNKQGETVRQETFYRKIRSHFNVLMTASDEPAGGQWNFDKKNRQRLPDNLQLPEILRFEPDAVTKEVMDEVSNSPIVSGDVFGFDLAVNRQQALQAVKDFIENRLPYFGTYEDAMCAEASVLFHAKLSPFLNIGLLDPLDLVKAVEKRYLKGEIEINNAEGFIRQVIGWREYMYWQYQRISAEVNEMNYWGFTRSLPAFFWDGKTDLHCLQTIIKRVLKEGYTHHIERLMVLSNFCLLMEIRPTDVFDWFSTLFIDAYAWVMVPNVYGMGLFADGGQVGSKPYLASANYINKMSDYCRACPYDHQQKMSEDACPFNFLYWSFLIKHEQKLKQNYRMTRTLYHLKNLDAEERLSLLNLRKAFLKEIV